jgi:hypothetical protein
VLAAVAPRSPLCPSGAALHFQARMCADRADDTAHAARNADQIKGRTVRESARRHEAEPAVTRHGSLAKKPHLDESTLRIMGALVRMPPHDEMKLGKPRGKRKKSPRRKKKID